MKKLLSLSLAAGMLLSTVPAMADAPSDMADEQVLKIAMGVDPEDWDPCNRINTTTSQQLAMVYDVLYRATENGDEPSLAESYEVSEDGKVYTFTLRDGIKFADGTDITAGDFVYTWKRAIDPNIANEYAWFMEYIKGASDFMYSDPTELSEEEFAALKDAVGVEAPDDKTLVVTLENPTPYFLSIVEQPPYAVLSEKFIEENGLYDTYGDTFEGIICSGPFVLTDWSDDVSLTFKKNEYYWDAENVYLDEIDMQIITDTSTELLMYDSDQLYTTTIPMTTADSGYYQDAAPEEFHASLILDTGWVQFNCDPEINEEKGWPFADSNVRKALVAAIDHDAVAEKIIGGGAVAATGFIPTSMKNPADASQSWNDGQAYIGTSQDIEAAKAYLEAAGWEWQGEDPADLSTGRWYKDGQEFPVVEVNMGASQDYNMNIATAWIGYWNQIGIQGALDPEETAARRETRYGCQFMVTFQGWGADYADASTFFVTLLSNHFYNYGHWINEEYDELINASEASTDQAFRYEQMLKAEQLIFDEMPIMMYQFTSKSYLEKEYLKGVYLSPLGQRDYVHAYIAAH